FRCNQRRVPRTNASPSYTGKSRDNPSSTGLGHNRIELSGTMRFRKLNGAGSCASPSFLATRSSVWRPIPASQNPRKRRCLSGNRQAIEGKRLSGPKGSSEKSDQTEQTPACRLPPPSAQLQPYEKKV